MTRRLWWWLTPLGRVRLALAGAEAPADPGRALARLERALVTLRGPGRAGKPGAAELLPQVLGRAMDLALHLGDLARATTWLRDLERSAPAESALDHRWALLVALMAAGRIAAVLDQGDPYAGNPRSDTAKTASLLRWALAATPDGARRLAAAVHPRLARAAEVATLRQLCLAPDELDDPAAAAAISTAVQPESLAGWPDLRARAHRLRARCAEVASQWGEMLAEAETALALVPDDPVGRYWQARALLRNGRAAEALAKLNGSGAAPPAATRLDAIAALAAKPELPRADACLRMLKGEEGRVSAAEVQLALCALRTALRPQVGDPAERLLEIRRCSERIQGFAGRLSWCEYNVAVHEVIHEGDFMRAQERLSALEEEAAPADGCPVALLRAACAAILGRSDALAAALGASRVTDGVFAADEDLLRAVQASLSALPQEIPATTSAARLASLTVEPGPLARAVPALVALAELLEDLLALSEGGGLTTPRSTAAAVAASPWANWIEQRMRLSSTPAADLAGLLVPAAEKACHPALLWERIGWRQELAAVMPAACRGLDQDLAHVGESLSGAPESSWHLLLELRRDLAAGLAGGAPPAVDSVPSAECPWFPPDGALQPLLQREARAELHYLEGRAALRLRSAERALACFQQARHVLDGEGPGGLLTALRFTPLLAYWEGAAQAHLGRHEEARRSLEICRGGPKAIEAEIQLGMLAFAGGNLDEAAARLRAFPEPLPGPACYLAALLAEAAGRPEESRRQLDRIITAEPSGAGVYTPAAWRLRGRLEEREGGPDRAAGLYRQALVCWPGDGAAAVRLSRILVREGLRCLAAGESWRPEPALEEVERKAAAIPWARPVVELRDWLRLKPRDAGEGNRPSPPAAPAGTAMRRLAVRLLVDAGLRREAEQQARSWSAEEPEDLPLAAAAAILSAAMKLRAFYEKGAPQPQRDGVESLAGRLASLHRLCPCDRSLAFWHDATRLALAPEISVSGDLFAAARTAEGDRLPAHAFAAVVGLFAEDVERRREAAHTCRGLLPTEALLDGEQRDTAAFLAALADGEDDELLTRYVAVEERLETLPGDVAEAYVAACEARLRTGAVEAITHGIIPDSLAELSHPDVQRVVGLAYAMSAARKAERDVRAALSEAQQAIELLAAKE